MGLRGNGQWLMPRILVLEILFSNIVLMRIRFLKRH